MKEKLNYTIVGLSFSMVNLLLIQTRFNLVGLFFGLISVYFLIKALRCKEH